MNISIIVAIARNHGIGFENKLLYWLPNDLKRFKALTTGHTIIMGSNHFVLTPQGSLPKLRNMVLSRREGAVFAGAGCFPALEIALSHCKEEEEIFIIGGASLYKEAMHIAQQLYITFIDDTSKEADAYFPEIKKEEWKERGREDHPTDEKHLYPYSLINYSRIK